MEVLSGGPASVIVRDGDWNVWIDPVREGVGAADEASKAWSLFIYSGCVRASGRLGGLAPWTHKVPRIGPAHGVDQATIGEGSVARSPVVLGAERGVWFPGGAGGSVLVYNHEQVIWLWGDAAPTSDELAAVLRLAPRRVTLVIPDGPCWPVEVQLGAARGFPSEAVAGFIEDVVARALCTGASIRVAAPITFVGRSAWLNAFAVPLAPDQLAGCLRERSPGLDACPLPGIPPTLPGFDPSRGVPPMTPSGEVDEQLLSKIELRLQAVCSKQELMPELRALERWSMLLGFVVIGAHGTERRVASLRPGGGEWLAESQDRANLIIRLTARAANALVSGTCDPIELALDDELRVFERVYRTQGTAVERPSWVGWQGKPNPLSNDRVYGLPHPFNVLRWLAPHDARR